MSLFSIVQGRTPPPPAPRPMLPQPQPGPMAVPPQPTSPANNFIPMGANIPAPMMPQGVPAPAPVGMPGNAPQMQAPPQMMPQQMPMGANIPGRIDGGHVTTIPGYKLGDDAPVDTSLLPTDDTGDGSTGSTSQGSDAFYQQNSGLSVDDWNALSKASKDMYVSAVNKKFFGNTAGPGSSGGGTAITGGEQAQIGFDYAKMAQDALLNQQNREDAYAKLLTDTGISKATLEQKNALDQAQLNQANRMDAGTLGLKAFDSNLAAMKQANIPGVENWASQLYKPNAQGIPGTAGIPSLNAPSFTMNAGQAAGTNLARPTMPGVNIPGVPTAEQMKAYANG